MITASNVIRQVATLLNDVDSVRWTIQELVIWLNAGQREVVTYRPDATSSYVEGTLAAGSRQSLDTIAETSALNAYKLLDVSYNTAVSSAKKSITQIDKAMLDRQSPGWIALPGTVDIEHFAFDPRVPRSFYVYPPALNTTKVELLISVYPTDIPTPSVSGGTYTDVTGTVGVSDTYINALVDYITFRALMKDSEVGETAQRAATYYQSFANALGIELRGTASVAPKPGKD